MPPNVYNVTVGRVELTRPSSEQVFVQAAFHQLRQQGFLPAGAQLSQYRDAIAQTIGNRDQDGYLDLDVRALAGRLRTLGVSIDPAALESALSEHPDIDAYFDDSAELGEVGRPAVTSPLARMTLAEGLAYFRRHYGSLAVWDAATATRFQADYNSFITSHFTDMPMDAEVAQAGGVNDHYNSRISDQTLQQFSRDRAGRYRVDCGVYTAVNAQIFEACGLEVRFGVATIETVDRRTAGHVFAFAGAGGQTFIANNGSLSAISGLGDEPVRRAAVPLLDSLGGRCLTIAFGDSLQGSLDAAAVLSQPIVLLYNSFVRGLAARGAAGLGNLLVHYQSSTIDDAGRYSTLRRLDEALGDLRAMVGLLPDLPEGFGIGGLTDRGRLGEFFGHVRTVLQAYRLAMTDMIGLDPLFNPATDRPEEHLLPNEYQNLMFDGSGRARQPTQLGHALRSAREFFQEHPRESRFYLTLIDRLLPAR